MAIIINDNYNLLTGNKALDARYLDITTPWADCASAIAGIPTYRYQGLTINIAGEEWWWKDGITDTDLVQKSLGGSSNLSGATNGLQLLCSNTYVGLGGVLTQDTTICGGYGLGLGNIASGLTAISAVTPTFQIYDDEVNSSLSFCHDQDTPRFDVCLFGDVANSCAGLILDVDVNDGYFNAYSAPNSICCSSICLQTTCSDNNVASYNVHSTNDCGNYVNETWISSACTMTCEGINDSFNSALNIKTVMDYNTRSFEFSKDNSIILSVLSGGTARYGSNVTLSNDCDLAHKLYVDNSAVGGENGLCKCGSNITLGGELTGNTTITTGTNVLDIYGSNAGFTPSLQLDGGQNAVNLIGGEAVFRLQGNNVILKPKATGSDCLSMNLNYTSFESTGGTGIRYAGDYETSFVARSLVTAQYVTGITSGIITSANNGLCKDGTNVRLGGDLTGATRIDTLSHGLCIGGESLNVSGNSMVFNVRGEQTIIENNSVSAIGVDNGFSCACIGISSTGFNVADSFTNTGLKYLTNYCAAGKTNPRWIPDNGYITGLTSNYVNSASNGLCLVGQDVKLGGVLTGNTNICLGGGGDTKTFEITNSGTTTCSTFLMNGTTLGMCAENINNPNQTGRVTVGSSGTVVCSGFANCFSSINMANSILHICAIGGLNNAYMRVTDNTATPRGLEYAACYHNTYCDRSLVDKQYVTSQVSGITGAFTTANNGLCSSGQVVSLGGNLTGNTTISADTNQFNVCGTNSNIKLSSSSVNLSGDTVELKYNNLNKITLNSGGTGIDGSMVFAQCKASYLTVFSSFTARELPDAAWVTGLTSQAISTANNGLTKNGTNVRLGGTLTGNTTIGSADVSGNTLSLTGETKLSTDSGYQISGVTVLRTDDLVTNIYLGADVATGSTGTDNTYIGAGAGRFNTIGTRNAFIGTNAGRDNISGNDSVAVGQSAAEANQTGTNFVAVGRLALGKNTEGVDNVAIGTYAMLNQTGATRNIAIGREALRGVNGNEIACDNIVIGRIAGYRMCTGRENVLMGNSTGNQICTGNFNTVLGHASFQSTNGSYNTIIGHCNANASNVGDNNVLVGHGISGLNAFSRCNTLVGSEAGAGLNDSHGNAILGYQAGQTAAFHTHCNVFVGHQAGRNIGTNGCLNVFIGNQAGANYSNDTKHKLVIANSSGSSLICGDFLNSGLTINATLNLGVVPASGAGSDSILVRASNGEIKTVTQSAVGTTTATNGVCVDGSNFVLGGDLTGNTTIGGAHTLNLNLSALNVTGATTINNTITLNSAATGDINTDEVLVRASNGEIKKITGTSLNVTANNGLGASNNNVSLGGTLTGDTCIDTGTNAYGLFVSTDLPQGSGCDANFSVVGNPAGSPYISLQSRNISGCGYAGYMRFSGGTIRVGKTGGSFPGIEYCADYTNNFNNCSLVTKEYVDEGITNNSNTLEVVNVTANYTATTLNDFIGVSGATEIWLPTTPKACQRIIVADICGNALGNNVCIIGNGLCINGSGSATINTDYGAVTFINNGFSWSAVAFIN